MLTLYLFDFLLIMDGCSLIDDCCQISMWPFQIWNDIE